MASIVNASPTAEGGPVVPLFRFESESASLNSGSIRPNEGVAYCARHQSLTRGNILARASACGYRMCALRDPDVVSMAVISLAMLDHLHSMKRGY